MKPLLEKSFSFLIPALFILSNNTHSQDVYENKQFGIKIMKPESWIVATNTDLQNNLNKIKFNDQELEKILESYDGILQLSAFFKYNKDSVAGLIPTIKVTIRDNPTTNMSDFKEEIIESTNQIKTVLKNFEFIETLKEVTISEAPSLYQSFRYSLILANGDNIKVRARHYMIPKRLYFISISLMDNETNEDCSQVIEKFIGNIKLTK